jgi:alpha-L-rhamnosidase
MNQMNLRKYWMLVLFITVSLKSFAALTEKPNIIFILTDDQRFDALGYAGNEVIQTPEMDKLAKNGAYFKNALVTTPICAASRASIFTGLYERTHKYTFQTGPVLDEFMSMSYPKLLKDAGYYTGFFGKFGVAYPGKQKIFDVIEDYDRNGKFTDRRGYFYKTIDGDTVHLTRYTGEKAIQFIEKVPEHQPFCLSLSFSAPHAHDGAEKQYFWQEATNGLHQDIVIADPELSDDTCFDRLPVPVKEGFNRTRWHWRYDTPVKYQHSVKGYYRMISGIDLEIGKIRKKLKEKGLHKNTVIIFMGDNGYFMGERQLAGKWLMYDNSIRVPLLIYDPRVKKSREIEEMALNIDVPATMLDLADVEIPAIWHGQSLVPLVHGKKTDLQRDTILIEHLWEFNPIPPSEGVRTKEWKYFRYQNNKAWEELYNVKEDPKEAINLAQNQQYKEVLISLRKACDALIEKYKPANSSAPFGLTVEYIREPHRVNINDSLPEFSWKVPDEAVKQTAYQLIVSSSKELISNNIGDVWNSGRVHNPSSMNVSLKGKALKSNTEYYWKIRIWDENKRFTDYSDVQKFRTGNFSGTVSTANVFQLEKIGPKKFTKHTDGKYFIDFGRAAFGKVQLHYHSTVIDTLQIRLGEKLTNNKIDRNPGGTIRYQEVRLPVYPGTTEYIVELPPDRRNTNQYAIQLPDSFGVIMPFRYCEIENASGLTDADVVQLVYFHYFDEDQSAFTSSDTVLNQVWEMCKYTMKATSFAGLYVDGDRERIPYEADAYINQLGHYCVDSEYAMARQTIEYFMDNPTWPTEWLLHTAMMFYQDYLFTGDTELLDAYYEQLKLKTLVGLVREDGLISSKSEKVDGAFMQKLGFKDTTRRIRDIVDWPPAQKDTGWKLATEEGERDGHQMLPVNTVVNSFFFLNMKIMAEMAGILENPSDSAFFQRLASRVKQSINQKLFDIKKGIYIDGEGATHSSLHSNMLPLAFGIVPEEHKKTVVEFVKSRGMACSVYGAQYLLEGLYEAGEEMHALELMRATDDRSWWNMIRIGSTIALEAWDMKYKPNADWNHAWGAAPANIIPRYLWGIQPARPGFKEVVIKPQMGDLKNSSIVFPTLRGQIKGSFERVSDKYETFIIHLPANMKGRFVHHHKKAKQVSLNGSKNLKELLLLPGLNTIELWYH